MASTSNTTSGRVLGVGLALLAWTGVAEGQAASSAPVSAHLAWAALGVDLDLSVRTYTIRASTVDRATSLLAHMGPVATDGTQGQGLTTYSLAVRWLPRRESYGCRPIGERVSARIVIDLPEWAGEHDAPADQVGRWQALVSELERHEADHRDLVLAAAHRLFATVDTMVAPSCPELSRRVVVRTRRASDALAAEQAHLDEVHTGNLARAPRRPPGP